MSIYLKKRRNIRKNKQTAAALGSMTNLTDQAEINYSHKLHQRK